MVALYSPMLGTGTMKVVSLRQLGEQDRIPVTARLDAIRQILKGNEITSMLDNETR